MIEKPSQQWERLRHYAAHSSCLPPAPAVYPSSLAAGLGKEVVFSMPRAWKIPEDLGAQDDQSSVFSSVGIQLIFPTGLGACRFLGAM